MNQKIEELISKTLQGDPVAMARLITYIENEDPQAPSILKTLYSHRKKPYRVGVTGPPGAGKSTLVDYLTLEARACGLTVGVVCVDPTSPFTGGALLGDRIRMSKAAADDGVFIRSMATRGSLGGIARTTEAVAEVLEASGKEIVFIETVGVGQSELDIFNAVDTVIVVLVPESGTSVQAMKAGLMEIAHIFVVNKADRAGAHRMKQEIEDVLGLAPPTDWEAQVFLTQAYRGIGVKDVFGRIQEHREFLRETEQPGRFMQMERKLQNLALEKIREELLSLNGTKEDMKILLDKMSAGLMDPYTAAEKLMKAGLKHWLEKQKS